MDTPASLVREILIGSHRGRHPLPGFGGLSCFSPYRQRERLSA